MFLSDAVTTPGNPFMDIEVMKAIIGAAATVAVAALGLYGVIHSASKPSKTKPPTGNTGPQALQTFSGTQNEFMALVITDNKTMREEIHGLRGSVEEIKEHQETFVAAVRRYLTKLASAWGHEAAMPWPDENDFHLLEDTLPNRGNRRREQ